MSATLSQWSIPMLAGLLLVTMPGCSKKSVQSGGDTQSSQAGMAKGTPGAGGTGGSTGSSSGGVSSNFPDTSLAGRDGSGGLRGLDKNPGEERVNGGTMMAKLDPSQSGRQMDEIRSEQAAADAAGLRDVFFGYDSFAISEEGRQALARNAEWIKANPGAQLKIEGHCDERGTSAYNLVLGEKRAKAARNYLVELGVSANRLGVVSYGKERPFCKEHSEACYAQNRRGHVVVKSGK
ncbi:MAG: peptidoglycan-associated lipoprotein Pal [Nitrospiraceae bacterium]|nr:peptidoglycan-associated lipoprotein Pal [Nitrospiraceae bacterium]OQW63276.1 MAG: peptidoglycan-associated lipoprotein [Nitrospira sp. ST-bin5]